MRHYLLPTAPLTACGLEVSTVAGATTVRHIPGSHHDTGPPGSGAPATASAGAPADRASVLVELVAGVAQITADDLCDGCRAQLRVLAMLPWWRRVFALDQEGR